MPGLQCEGGVMAVSGSPIKKSKLSLKFFHKKETKRALDFSEAPAEEPSAVEPEETTNHDQVVPIPCPSSSPTCEKQENLVPFVGLNNLGNTCYLNSILQVLYYCPGFKEAIKSLCDLAKLKDKQQEDGAKTEENCSEDSIPAHMELLGSFHSLISSVEQLQSNFLLHPEKFCDGELSTPPRRLLNTLRQLNPMYEGYLQHDAQEVLQCILANIQEACDTIKKEKDQKDATESSTTGESTSEEDRNADGQLSGKRKSDTEAGNAKKKPKSQSKSKKSADSAPITRSKRKSSSDVTTESSDADQNNKDEQRGNEQEKERGSTTEEEKSDISPKEVAKTTRRGKLGWLKPSGKQPSIFSKFRSMGRLTSHAGGKEETKEKVTCNVQVKQETDKNRSTTQDATDGVEEIEERSGLDVLKWMFQGQLVLRTRCLECECYTERREDFQDISVPVQEDETSCSDSSSEISPDPKPELKTLKWGISQFASVERIVGEDKYFCENCHHYTEAERSLLFDKTPEVITIHLKCFAANGSEMDPYAGLSKVNTPLQTPLKLSLNEWCTHSDSVDQKHIYELFAVVMHSGVTISSGHYTTYIRMMDLQCTNLKPQPQEGEQDKEEDMNQQKKDEVPETDYDDGEVSFSLSGRGQKGANRSSVTNTSSKAGSKRCSEGVALLGGQRSNTTFELGSSKQTNPEKTSRLASRASGCLPQKVGVKTEIEEDGVDAIVDGNLDLALQNLLDFEGKWMLFDDSEVRLFEEEDFLRACSPETCSTSTPYLLFYKRVSQ